MVKLFISDRIFIDGIFYNGAIAVSNDGTIDEVFKDPSKVDEWLNANSHVEVNYFKCIFLNCERN